MNDYLDSEFEPTYYTNNETKIYAPRELTAFLQKTKCPVCGSELDSEDPYIFNYGGQYHTYSDCSRDAFDYEISLSWEDPKNIILNHEEISFVYENNVYKIKKNIINYNHSAILNDIVIIPLDDEGEADSNKKEISFSIPGKVFNFKIFSKKNIANRINMIKVFT